MHKYPRGLKPFFYFSYSLFTTLNKEEYNISNFIFYRNSACQEAKRKASSIVAQKFGFEL